MTDDFIENMNIAVDDALDQGFSKAEVIDMIREFATSWEISDDD